MQIRSPLVHRLMNEAVPAEAGGADGGAPAPEAAAPAAAPAPAPAAAGSALSAAVAPAPMPPLSERIAEKYRVMGADGKLDMEATLAKVEEGRIHLEKRLGSGDVRPAAVTDYKVTVPEAMAEQLKGWDMAKDEKLQGFLADAHKAGMTQAQVDVVMSRYMDLAPKLAGAAAMTPEQQAQQATQELQKVWADPNAYQQNLGAARKAAEAFAGKAGLSFEDIEASGLGNNPAFIRMMAALGPELSEDAPIDGNEAAVSSWEEEVANLKAEKESIPERDPRRQIVQNKINAMYEKRYNAGKAN